MSRDLSGLWPPDNHPGKTSLEISRAGAYAENKVLQSRRESHFMPGTSTHIDLLDEISGLLKKGVFLSDRVMHAIDATFSARNADELVLLLNDPSNCETESILELIFYPDQAFQEIIEPRLPARPYAPADVDAIARSLAFQNLDIPVILPHRRGCMKIRLTESIGRQLLRRLNIHRRIDPHLSEVLSRRVTKSGDLFRFRVLLRNHTKAFSAAAVDFLTAWIEKMYGKSPYFEKAFRFLLDFFDYAAPETDMYRLLMKEKGALVQQIARAEKFEAALGSHPMETLMLRGMPRLCADTGDLQKKCTLIDHICLSMFGKTEMMDLSDGVAAAISLPD